MNVLKNLFILNTNVEENIFLFVAREDYTFHIDEECASKNGLSHEVCGFCFSVRYLLNLKCYKIFVEEYQIILWIKLFLWILI